MASLRSNLPRSSNGEGACATVSSDPMRYHMQRGRFYSGRDVSHRPDPMELARNIIRSMLQVGQQAQNATAQRRYLTRGIRHVRQHSLVRLESDLQMIVDASRAILEVLDNPLVSRHYLFDERLMDWLKSPEPKTCLDAVRKMEKALSLEQRDVQVWSAFTPTRSTREEDEIHAAIVLFQAHKAHFHFMLTTEIWNHENILRRQMLASKTAESNVPGDEHTQLIATKDSTMEIQEEDVCMS